MDGKEIRERKRTKETSQKEERKKMRYRSRINSTSTGEKKGKRIYLPSDPDGWIGFSESLQKKKSANE